MTLSPPSQQADLTRCATCRADLGSGVQLRPGLPPSRYCSHACRVVAKVAKTLLEIPDGELNPDARRVLRRATWRAVNRKAPTRGRRPGTHYWELGLDCGHEFETKARSRLRNGRSELDPAPKFTRCPTCGVRHEVIASALRTQQ